MINSKPEINVDLDDTKYSDIENLVKASFGTTVEGNMYVATTSRDPMHDISETKHPAMIIRRRLGFLPYNLFGIKLFGAFADGKGSHLLIRRKYLDEANNYSLLYEQKFGNKPKIEVVNGVNHSRVKRW